MTPTQLQVINELINNKQQLKKWAEGYPSFLNDTKNIYKSEIYKRLLHKMLYENNPTIFTGGETEYGYLKGSQLGQYLIKCFYSAAKNIIAKSRRFQKNIEKGNRRAAAAKREELFREQLDEYVNIEEGDNRPEAQWLLKVGPGMPKPEKKGGQKRATNSRDANTGAGPSTSKRSKRHH